MNFLAQYFIFILQLIFRLHVRALNQLPAQSSKARIFCRFQSEVYAKKERIKAEPPGLYTAKLEKNTKQGRKRERRQFFKNDQRYCVATALKGLSHEIFRPFFLVCMDISGPEYDPLVVLKF